MARQAPLSFAVVASQNRPPCGTTATGIPSLQSDHDALTGCRSLHGLHPTRCSCVTAVSPALLLSHDWNMCHPEVHCRFAVSVALITCAMRTSAANLQTDLICIYPKSFASLVYDPCGVRDMVARAPLMLHYRPAIRRFSIVRTTLENQAIRLSTGIGKGTIPLHWHQQEIIAEQLHHRGMKADRQCAYEHLTSSYGALTILVTKQGHL